MTYPWAAGEVLTAADLNAYAGLVLVKSQTIGTTVASVTVTDAFSSTFDNYRLVVDVDAGSATGQSLYLRFGATAANYYSVKFGYRWGGTTVSAFINNGAQMDIGAFSSEAGGSLSVDVFAPNLARETKVNGLNAYGRVTTTPEGGILFCGGVLNDTTAYTAFTLTATAGTMTGGTIKVYGYNNG
jgi:hypothetical protein